MVFENTEVPKEKVLAFLSIFQNTDEGRQKQKYWFAIGYINYLLGV
jgi:hypothetical protein